MSIAVTYCCDAINAWISTAGETGAGREEEDDDDDEEEEEEERVDSDTAVLMRGGRSVIICSVESKKNR